MLDTFESGKRLLDDHFESRNLVVRQLGEFTLPPPLA
jgi:hypothetical protein